MDLVFFVSAILIVKSSFDKDGYLKEGRLRIGKIFSAVVLVIQWNYFLYMLPTRTFWGFLFFFLILMAFFLDIKMLLVSGLACMVSLFTGWFIRGTDLLPVKDGLFLMDVLMCLVALVLSLAGLLIFVFFVAHFLVDAKKDELERNNERVMSILKSVETLTSSLYTAGFAIYDTMQYIRCDVSTICVGFAASFGAFLLAGGAKGKRMALPDAEIMIHQPAMHGNGIQGPASDIKIMSDYMQKSKQRMNRILAENTGKTIEEIELDTDRDNFMSADQAQAYGLIDKIITGRN